jgi:transcriptional regulator with XRE-family HTH domain
MNLGSKITELRKQKEWSQSELARQIDVSREIVGRYERNDAVPSIEVAQRMAEAFEVSLDFLVGNTEQEVDKDTLKRLQEINRLSDENKKMVYTFLDSFITKIKLQSVL